MASGAAVSTGYLGKLNSVMKVKVFGNSQIIIQPAVLKLWTVFDVFCLLNLIELKSAFSWG